MTVMEFLIKWVVWKALCLFMAAVLLYGMETQPAPADTFEHVVVYTMAAFFVLAGIFTRLGDG